MNPATFVWIIYGLWVLLVLYLTISAIGAKRDTQGHLLQSFGILFAMIAAFALPHLEIFRFVNFAPVSPSLSTIGVIITVVGMMLFVWARQTLGGNWSQTVSAKEGPELVTSGPYRHVRHPMYSSGLIACIGSAMAAGGAFVFLFVFLTPLFLWRVGAEDRLMSQQFPNEYPAYKERTKALIPFVW